MHESFNSLRPGDRVTFMIPAGLSLQRTSRGYRTVQDWAKKTGKVVMTFPSHVVVNGGGRSGTPYVVDHNNYLSAKAAQKERQIDIELADHQERA